MLSAFILSAAVLYVYWSFRRARERVLFLLTGSLFFIALFSPVYSLYYLLLSALAYAAFRIGRRRGAVAAFLVINLCFFKYYSFLAERTDLFLEARLGVSFFDAPQIIFPIGLSFVTFRAVHFL
ncbi:MAG: hypothetical protein GF408_07125, partial [Candidatus Omnitrophica bacterium]|nr:hypothetical protein [Candidatus Omnitrophota bacterium]